MLEQTLRAVIRKLKAAYPASVIVTEADKIVNGRDSFFVEVGYSLNNYSTKYFNNREITVTITHVPATKSERRKINAIVDNLNLIFNRFLTVEKRQILINNTNSQVLRDEHGYYLVYIIQMPYLEGVYPMEVYEPMGEVILKPSLPPESESIDPDIMEEVHFGIINK